MLKVLSFKLSSATRQIFHKKRHIFPAFYPLAARSYAKTPEVPNPADRKYAKTHEWIKVDKEVGTVGITDYAQRLLDDVVFVELPEVGRTVKSGESCSAVESAKAASDVYTPVAGTITEVNKKLNDEPGTINKDAFGSGWMFKLKLSNPKDLQPLLDAAAYTQHIKDSDH